VEVGFRLGEGTSGEGGPLLLPMVLHSFCFARLFWPLVAYNAPVPETTYYNIWQQLMNELHAIEIKETRGFSPL